MRIWDMWCAGARALRERWRLAAGLYGVQLGLSLVFLLAVARTFSGLFSEKGTTFARGVGGDPLALMRALQSQPGATAALASAGVALVVAYAVLSWYLSAGTLGALAGESFSEAAGDRFFAYMRVWLWSLIPYAAGAIVASIGMGAVLDARSPLGALTWFDAVGLPVLGALPGLLLVGVTACVTQYAQAILAAERSRRATRAVLRAWRLVFTRPWPLIHYFIYVVFWALITALYAHGTLGTTFAGFGGALLLFLLRQAIAITRFGLRFGTTAGQLAGVMADPRV